MLEVEFSDEIKRLKHFTKVDENTWFVQRDKDSIMESYYVTVLHNAIVMYGDFDGVIVQPYCKKEALINWMANATTLGYFCEKVGNGNRHHTYMEYSSKIAKESALDQIGYKFELSEEVLEIIKKADAFFSLSFDSIKSDIIEQLALDMNCHQDNVEKDVEVRWDYTFVEFEECVSSYLGASFEQEKDYCDFCEEHNFADWYEHSYEDYTFRIKHQHQCLLWWARNVIKQEAQKSGS